jgi:hypothetical protein
MVMAMIGQGGRRGMQCPGKEKRFTYVGVGGDETGNLKAWVLKSRSDRVKSCRGIIRD